MSDGPKVLLVEDDAILASMLRELLVGEGYEVVLAADGQRALHEGLSQSFDVLLMDRGLPAIEGLDVLGRLRNKGISTPALILSALSNPADRVEGLDRGAEDYLCRPFDIVELLCCGPVRRRHGYCDRPGRCGSRGRGRQTLPQAGTPGGRRQRRVGNAVRRMID